MLIISRDAYSNKMELLANNKAFRFGLLKAAAVPIGDFGSTPPSEMSQKHFTCYSNLPNKF